MLACIRLILWPSGRPQDLAASARLHPAVAMGLSLVLLLLLCLPFALAAGWFYANVFAFGPGVWAPLPWPWGFLRALGQMLLPYLLWLLLVVGLHWAVVRRSTWRQRGVLASRFALAYYCLWVIPQHIMLVWIIAWAAMGTPLLPKWVGMPSVYALQYGVSAISIAAGLMLLGGGLALHRRVMTSGSITLTTPT